MLLSGVWRIKIRNYFHRPVQGPKTSMWTLLKINLKSPFGLLKNQLKCYRAGDAFDSSSCKEGPEGVNDQKLNMSS